jgi:caffeoyl-CoA O-methyltransferase
MGLKYLSLNDKLYCYLKRFRSDAGDPIIQALRAETSALGDISIMQISEDQATFMGILVAAIGAKSAIEVGTFTGLSSLCIARALPPTGRLLCLDQSEEWTAIARKYWAKAGVQDRIELRLGAAIPLLKSLEPGRVFDFAFIDAAKTEYDAYYELVLPRVRPNGLILFDNMLDDGKVAAEPIQDERARGLDALNHKLAKDTRVECVLLSVSDGIQLCRKR